MTTASPQPRRVNFGWISESFQLFQRDIWIWTFAVIVQLACAWVLGFAMTEAFNLIGFALPRPVFDRSHPFDSLFGMYTTPRFWEHTALRELVILPINSFFYGGLYKMANKSVRGQAISIADVFSGGPTFLTFLLFNLLMLVGVRLGLLCVIFGAFVVSGLLLPAGGLLADGVDFRTAIKTSIKAKKGDWLRAAGFSFVFGCVFVGSFLACCIPMLATLSMGFIISSLSCREMVAGEGRALEVEEYVAPPGSWPPPPKFNIAPTERPLDEPEAES